MTLQFDYRRFSLTSPAIALGGALTRDKPVIPVTVIGPTNSYLVWGLLDPGSDDTVFDEDLAELLGIDLDNAPFADLIGVGGSAIRVRYAPVTFRLWSPHERREWSALVGFPEGSRSAAQSLRVAAKQGETHSGWAEGP